jgi:hypothetical protein
MSDFPNDINESMVRVQIEVKDGNDRERWRAEYVQDTFSDMQVGWITAKALRMIFANIRGLDCAVATIAWSCQQEPKPKEVFPGHHQLLDEMYKAAAAIVEQYGEAEHRRGADDL